MVNGLSAIWRKFPERYALLGNKCLKCGQSFFPARPLCHNCRRRGKLVDEQMPREGKIISWTEVSSGPEGFEHEAPYFLALIELANRVRILAQIVDSNRAAVKTGAMVKMVFRKISDTDAEGPIAYGYKFKVV